MRARCGSVRAWHWAHVARECDHWHEPESEWHLGWKRLAPPKNCEVIVGEHRADIRGERGVVVELQNSAISIDTIREREDFYGEMIWIVNAHGFSGRLEWWEKLYRGNSEQLYFNWRRPRRSWFAAQRPVFLDLGIEELSLFTWDIQRRWKTRRSSGEEGTTYRRSVDANDTLAWIRNFGPNNRCDVTLVPKHAVVEKYFL